MRTRLNPRDPPNVARIVIDLNRLCRAEGVSTVFALPITTDQSLVFVDSHAGDLRTKAFALRAADSFVSHQ